MRFTARLLLLGLSLASLACFARPAAAEGFPPITEKERSLLSVPGEPNARGVILFRKSEFLMMGYGVQKEKSSRLLVQERRKILTEQGKELSEVAVAHSSLVRLSGFKGRTVLPDGRVLPLGGDATFKRKPSRRQGQSVTTVAFPGVEVGAILDVQYELRFDHFFYLEPWYLADELPVLHAEIVFKIPREVRAQSWIRDSLKVGIQTENRQTSTGTEIRLWANDVPSVPEEPFGLPFADMATYVLMLPLAFDSGGYETKLLESWETVCKLVNGIYDDARRNDGQVVKKARELAAAGRSGAREKAEALYRFVRDDIETVHEPGVFLADDSSLAKTLTQRRGDYAEKALLLQTMLRAEKLDARLVWAADRSNGMIDTRVANPSMFDTLLVAVDLDGTRHYLDPSDRSLNFGRLRFGYEGMPALLFDPKKPQPIVLPESSFEHNTRRTLVELSLDADGGLMGQGEAAFTGHHAWRRIRWQADEAATLEGWTTWLAQEYAEFQIGDVQFQENVDQQTVRVTWAMKQREEAVLGDEASLTPSQPFGPAKQPFVQAASKRRSPVLFAFPDREEVELRLRWPATWKLETQPTPVIASNRAGELSITLERNDDTHSLVYRRRLDLPQRQLDSNLQIDDARSLFRAAEKSDAESLVLVRAPNSQGGEGPAAAGSPLPPAP